MTTDDVNNTQGASSLQGVDVPREQEPSVCMGTTGGGERVEELWHQFEEWFVPRNRFTPTKGDSRVEEMWQAYLCGRLDELQDHSLPKNVMRDALKSIQATLDESGRFLEEVERERAKRNGIQGHTKLCNSPEAARPPGEEGSESR